MPRELTIDERFTLIGQGIDPDDVEAIDDSEVEPVDDGELPESTIPISTNDKQANSNEKPGLWDRATTPLLPIPRTTGAELNQALPWLNPTVAKVIAGGQQAVAGLGESFTSPLGITATFNQWWIRS